MSDKKDWSALEQQLLDEISAKIESLDYEQATDEELQTINWRLEQAIASSRMEGQYQTEISMAIDDLLLKARLPRELFGKLRLESVHRKVELGII